MIRPPDEIPSGSAEAEFPVNGTSGLEDICSFSLDEFEVDYTTCSEPEIDLHSACTDFFAPGGTLSQLAKINGRPCEERPQQLEMALAIATALQRNENLCVEAPTGIGKSFAYLIPLIFRSQICRRPALISTETINLQQQLIEKDIPFLREATGIPFRAALAKGRQNYVCRRRLALLSGDQRDALLPVPSLVLDTERLIRKLENGLDGERGSAGDSIDPSVWQLVCSESGNCAGAKCEFYRNCYYFKARRQWDEADIVVANHALFLTDLAIRSEGGGGALLPDYGAVLIDEAHTLENNAAEYLGVRLSQPGIVSMLNKLFNPERMRGLLMHPGSRMPELRQLTAHARDEAYGFFAPYTELVHRSQENSLRLKNVPDEFPDRLTPALTELGKSLDEALEELDDNAFRTELEGARERCRSTIDALNIFSNRQMPDAVYYIEENNKATSLHVSPLNIPELLQSILFSNDIPVMLCSATLTVRNSFDYFVSRTGFSGGEMIKLDSPFSPEQAKIIIPRELRDPNDEDYLSSLVKNIRKYVELTSGKAFVLFTSYQAMRYCAEMLQDEFEEKGWRLLLQGGELSRNRMLEEFRNDVNSVLFGTDSFWTGVDVPGESLSMVILTRLPFASPGHPLIAARLDRITESGKSSFAHYSLPEAILKFRQGAGRLIRSRTDTGYIVILDPRVISKGYGRGFLDSIPYGVVF
ncbi:MAG: DEAD/DEAH box helicase [Lentisphaeria bacterium]|nr:DEAD/DEAH box helicase [Lentisphaeria bacterium]